MSFSQKVKSELCHQFGTGRHCNIGEIAAIINSCGEIIEKNGQICLKIHTENVTVGRKYFTLVKKTFNIDSEILARRNNHLKKNRVFTLNIIGEDNVFKVLNATGIEHSDLSISRGIYPLIVQSACCRRSYLRGAFLSCGSVSDPEKTYHLEFVSSNLDYSLQLQELMNTFDLDAKIVERKDNFVVYLKEGEKIVDLLNIMGAYVALMELENVRILKDMRNNVNRIVNCETANLNKTISASVKQIEDIIFIKEKVGLFHLPSNLREIAQIRLEFPDASLKELGEMANKPIGKSGVNHRLRKICEIAEGLREEKGEE